jgi:hypothetical protein
MLVSACSPSRVVDKEDRGKLDHKSFLGVIVEITDHNDNCQIVVFLRSVKEH